MTPQTSSFNADAAATFYVEAGDNRIAYRVMGPEGAPSLMLAMRLRGVMDESIDLLDRPPHSQPTYPIYSPSRQQMLNRNP